MGDWESTLAAPSVTDSRSRDNEQLAVATVYRSTDWTGTTLKEVSRQRCKHCPVPSEQPWRDPVEPVLRRYCRSAYQLRRNGGNPQAGHKAAVLIGWADRKGRGGREVSLGGIMIGLGSGGPGATKSNGGKTLHYWLKGTWSVGVSGEWPRPRYGLGTRRWGHGWSGQGDVIT